MRAEAEPTGSSPTAARSVGLGVIARALRGDQRLPLHRQLEVSLRGLIRAGEVRAGDVLPGEHELAAGLGVSRHTIRHALGVLASEGLVRRSRGRGGGTRVLTPAPASSVVERGLDSFSAFAWGARATHASQHAFVLERTRPEASRALAARLGLSERAPVDRIVRLRTADGVPLVLETRYLPLELGAELDAPTLERGSIYEALEQRCGILVVQAHETLRPIVVRRPVAGLLAVRSGAPAFAVERLTLSQNGPIEWQESVVRGDRYTYSVDLTRHELGGGGG
jgi:GntR family transcriptional regulator